MLAIRLTLRNISDWSKNSKKKKLVSYQLFCLETSRVWGQLWWPNLSTPKTSKNADWHIQERWGSVEIWLKGETRGIQCQLCALQNTPRETRGLSRGVHDETPAYNCTMYTAWAEIIFLASNEVTAHSFFIPCATVEKKSEEGVLIMGCSWEHFL